MIYSLVTDAIENRYVKMWTTWVIAGTKFTRFDDVLKLSLQEMYSWPWIPPTQNDPDQISKQSKLIPIILFSALSSVKDFLG